MSEIADAVRVAQPGAELFTLGRHQGLSWSTTTPAFTIVANVVEAKGAEGAFLVQARDSYDPSVAEALFDAAVSLGLDFSSAVVRLNQCSLGRFDELVFVPPAIAQLQKHGPALLRDSLGWVIPAHHGEFRDGQPGEEFWYSVHRGGKISPINWNREPCPLIRVQLMDAWPGGMLARTTKAFTFLDSEMLTLVLQEIPHGLRLRIVNSLQQTLVVSRLESGELQLIESSGLANECTSAQWLSHGFFLDRE
jgi:hypothetical protein